MGPAVTGRGIYFASPAVLHPTRESLPALSPVRAVLHITSAPGGGVDRYIRDIAATSSLAHVVLHVGRELDVIEDIATSTFWPVPAGSAAVAQVLARTTSLAHLHGVDDGCRDRVRKLRAQAPMPLVTTLHDVGFVYREAFATPGALREDRAWIDEVAALVSTSDAVIVPSEYMRVLARQTIPSVTPVLIAPGVQGSAVAPSALPKPFLERQPRHVVAVVGAIGPHKGSALLDEIAAGLGGLDTALVVIGYTDTQLRRGWRSPAFFVHGPYTDGALPGLLAAYAPRLVLFPNRLPESFSYTLSEVWSAGIPVVVPDEGALGERVRASGGGWLLPARFDAAAAVALVSRLLSSTATEEWRRVKLRVVPHSDSIPELASMARGVAAVYARFGLVPGAASVPPDLSALTPLLASNLSGLVFREELVHLCEALENSESAARAASAEAEAQTGHAADLQQWADKLQRDIDEARAWAAKVETDVAALKSEIESRDASISKLELEVAQLSPIKAAVDTLPAFVRERLMRRAQRGRA